MTRKFYLIVLVPLMLLIFSSASAHEPGPPYDSRYWQVAFWNNIDFSGRPEVTAVHNSLDWDWGYGSPDPRIHSDGFSGRWTRSIETESGTFQFMVTSDDGVRLYVDNRLVIDEWREQPAATYTANVPLTAGYHLIIVDYYEKSGLARLSLNWRSLPVPTPVPPPTSTSLIIDDGDPGFVSGGSATAWHRSPDGYGGDILWTKNNDRIRPKYNWARWYPDLAAGRYEVYVHIPWNHATTRQARYWVSHQDGYSLRVVNQGATNGWLSLGTYRFLGSRSDFVSLADVTFEPTLSRSVGFDAVKWVRR